MCARCTLLRLSPGLADRTSALALESEEGAAESAQVNVPTPPVAPKQIGVLGWGGELGARPPPRLQERAVGPKTPPPAAPVSFVRQQQEIQANGGRPPAISQMRQQRGGN